MHMQQQPVNNLGDDRAERKGWRKRDREGWAGKDQKVPGPPTLEETNSATIHTYTHVHAHAHTCAAVLISGVEFS